MLPQNKPDRIRILFDDHRLVANAVAPIPVRQHRGVQPVHRGDGRCSRLRGQGAIHPGPSCAASGGGMSVNSTA